MLDLKGPDPRLPRAVLAAARERLAGPGLIVSGGQAATSPGIASALRERAPADWGRIRRSTGRGHPFATASSGGFSAATVNPLRSRWFRAS